jgi:hypothetical protein
MRPASPCRGGRRASSLHCRCGLVAPDRNSPSKQRPLGRSSTTLVTTAIAPPALTRTPERLLSPDSTSRARSRWWPPIGVRREGRARGADRPHVVLRARRRVPERRPSARPPARTPRRAALVSAASAALGGGGRGDRRSGGLLGSGRRPSGRLGGRDRRLCGSLGSVGRWQDPGIDDGLQDRQACRRL